MAKSVSLSSAVPAKPPSISGGPVHKSNSSQQYLSLLCPDLDDAIVGLDALGVITSWNMECEAILGHTEKEMVGQPIGKLKDACHGHIESVLTSGLPLRFEEDARHSDGSERAMNVLGIVTRDDGGAVTGYSLILRKSSEQSCVNCGLLHYLDAVNRDSADGIIILDAQERIQSWNAGAELIFGYSAAEIIGKMVSVIVPDEKLEAGELDFLRKEVSQKGFVRNHETSRRTKDGQVVSVEITRSAIHDSDGAFVGSSAIVRDTTARKHLEERLIHSERLAVVGKMAAQVAHELRNPLSAISLSAELLSDEIDTFAGPTNGTEAKSLLESITREIERLAAVSEEYLQFARMPQMKPSKSDLSMLVEDIAEFAGMELAKAGVEVKVDTEPIEELSVDRKQIRQVLINLIRNALGAMLDGGTLTLNSRPLGDFAEVVVMDTGTGITPEVMERMFEPFFSTKEGVTGLGLALGRQVAHEHCGELVVESTVGKGTVFTLRLPLKGIERS